MQANTLNKQWRRRSTVTDDFLPSDLHPVVRQLYARRGVSSNKALDLTLANLLPLTSMTDLTLAAQLLYQGIANNKRLLIIGDFDADGATSTALMMEGLTLLGSYNHQFLVPNRFEFGYGLTPEIVDIAVAQGAEIIVTVDSGISCHRGIERAKQQGCQVIVTDHHMPGETLPTADAIVNPNRKDCQFASKHIAGVGVAFYFLMALRAEMRAQNWFYQQGFNEPNLAQLLDLVALGTVADVVALDNNNRILVAQGIKRIQAGLTRPGIMALLKVASKDHQRVQASDMGFALGPRINAAGRLDDMSLGIHCLLAKDDHSAMAMATELDSLNQVRKNIEQDMQQQAGQIVDQLVINQTELPLGLALFHPNWHQGVIGIVAGRLKERFYRPCVVFAPATDDESSNEIKGSARSIPGVHIRDLLEKIDCQYPDLIIKFGGHAMAAGLSIEREKFSAFQQAFTQVLAQVVDESKLANVIWSDGELSAQELSLNFAQLLAESGPWGQQFEAPLFDGEFELIQQRLVGERHLKMVVAYQGVTVDAIMFNCDLQQWPAANVNKIKLAYQLDINEFRGQRSVQLLVSDMVPA